MDGGRDRFGGLLWKEFSGSVRVLLANPYVFQDFWNSQNGALPPEAWKSRFEAANRAAQVALGKHDTVAVLGIVLSRIYTLRNQLIHGGATWASSVNRSQLRDCVNFMGKLVPLVIEVMMDHPETLWGDACYPVLSST